MAVNKSQQISILVIVGIFILVGIGLPVVSMFSSSSESKDESKSELDSSLDENQCGSKTPDPVAAKDVPGGDFKVDSDVTELSITDIQQGTGDEVKEGDCVQALYHGTLAKTGEKFDGNFDTGQAMEIPLSSVIEGWQKGVPGMKVGGIRRLIIPSEMAYKSQSSEKIPADSDLIFIVEVVGTRKP